MALKIEVSSLDDVEESVRDLYNEKDGKFFLSLDGLEDTGALKRAKDHEKAARKKVEESLASMKETHETMLSEFNDLKRSIDDAKNDGHRKKGDIEALENSWKEKLARSESDGATALSGKDDQIKKLLVNSAARELAGQLAVEGSADALYLPIKARLAVAERDGTLATAVLDADGKPSALTLDELKQEFAGNKAFAPLIAGSKGSGSGANGNQNGAGGPKNFNDMNEAERLSLYRDNKPEYERLREAS